MKLLSQEYKEFFTNIKSNSQQAVDQFVVTACCTITKR